MRQILGLVSVTLLFASVYGCGGSSQGGLCQQVGEAVCAKACSCREGPTCAISQGGLTIDFDSESDCKVFYVTLGCSMGDKAAYKDAAACQALIGSATCTGTGTEAALSYPSDQVCESTQSD